MLSNHVLGTVREQSFNFLSSTIIFLRDVIKVLEDWGQERKETKINKIVVRGSSVPSVNQEYHSTSSYHIPPGFDSVCQQQGWPTEKMWVKLNGDRNWYRAHNEAYIYWNTLDKSWWIDKV